MDRARDALPLAERALTVSKQAELAPLSLARIEFALARALPPTDRVHARSLATAAREDVARNGRDTKLPARIDTWLATAP
jgi:hypothetical protein